MAAIRFGLIGMGKHGMRYARHLMRDIKGATLTAVCRQDQLLGSTFAREHNVRYYKEYLDLLGDPQIDAVVVATPARLHERICTTALGAGKAVLVEKPMACNTREAINIVEAASRANRPLMVAHTMRFNSVVQALEQQLDTIGAMHTISMCQRLEPPEQAWLDDFAHAGGGAILQTGIHLFDLLRYLSGDEVRQVHCELSRVFYEELEDLMVATMRLRRSKIHCILDVARYTAGRSGRIELVGEHGQLMGDFEHGYAMVVRGRRATPLDVAPPAHTLIGLLNAFVQAFQEDEEPPISALDGYHAVEIAEACYESASAKVTIEIEADDEDEGLDEWDVC